MKKILILCLVVAMALTLSSVAMASPLGVNVDKGWSISLEKPDTDADPFLVTANFGISDKLLLSVGYITEDEWDEDGFKIGGRYEFINNGAVAFEYVSFDYSDVWEIDLRGKWDLSDKLALAGLVGYINQEWDCGCEEDAFRLLGQVEYDFSSLVTGNLGVDYYNYDDDDTTLIVAGLEFYPNKNITLWANYNYDIDDDYGDDDWFGVGVEFKFN